MCNAFCAQARKNLLEVILIECASKILLLILLTQLLLQINVPQYNKGFIKPEETVLLLKLFTSCFFLRILVLAHL